MHKEASLTFFKVIAWSVGVYHAILGLVGLLGTAGMIQQAIAWTYQINPTLDMPFMALLHFTSSFMLALGAMMIMVAMNPKKYQMFIWPAVIMFGARLVDNVVNFSTIQTAFGVGSGVILLHIVLVTFFGAILIICKPKAA